MSTDRLAASDKQIAMAALHRISDAATLDEISEEFAILAAIRRGEAAANAGRVLTHAEVETRSAEWTGK